MTYTKKMLVEDWIKVEDNPIQRDTERHAAKAKHLRTPHPTHSIVHAAELPAGKLIKLDGHTRALLWRRKEVDAPIQVVVVVYPVKDRAEAEQLYKDFDSKDALETMRDKVYGAFNRHHFEPQSPLLQYGTIVQALRLAYGVLIGGSAKTSSATGTGTAPDKDRRTTKQKSTASVDVYGMIDEFSYELHALDGFGLRQGQITSGVMGAFFITYRKYGHKITPFWHGVFGNQGSKTGGSMDGVQAVCELILAAKGKGSLGKMQTAAMAERCVMAVEKWLRDELMIAMPRPFDTTGYLVGAEKPSERLIKKIDLERAKIDRERKSA